MDIWRFASVEDIVHFMLLLNGPGPCKIRDLYHIYTFRVSPKYAKNN